MVGGTWGRRHIHDTIGRWHIGQEQTGRCGRWVNGEGGWAGMRHGLVYERDTGGAKVVGHGVAW